MLTLDVLRERGNNDKHDEDAGTPPVLNYDYELIGDGRKLPCPVNYQLLWILPPKGVPMHYNAGLLAGVVPGLYEKKIDETAGDEGHEHFFVSFHERRMKDILGAVENDRDQEKGWAMPQPIHQRTPTERSAHILNDT